MARTSLLIAAVALAGCNNHPTWSVPVLPHVNWTHRQIGLVGPTPREVWLPDGGKFPVLLMADGGDAFEIKCGKVARAGSSLNALLWEVTTRQEETRVRYQLTAAFAACEAEARRVCQLETRNPDSTFAILRRFEWIGEGIDSGTNGISIYARCLTPDAFNQYVMTLKRRQVSDDVWETVLERLIDAPEKK